MSPSPGFPFISASIGFLRWSFFLQPQCFPPYLSKISSFSPGLFCYGNSWLPTSLRFSEGLSNAALICPSVMLFSLSLWQGLRREPGKEGGGRKMSGEKQDETGEGLIGGWWSRRKRRMRLSVPRMEEGSLFCFVLFWFGFFSLGLFSRGEKTCI